MDSYQRIYQQYLLEPSIPNLLECLYYLNSVQEYPTGILGAVQQGLWGNIYQRRRELTHSYGNLILRHLYLNLRSILDEGSGNLLPVPKTVIVLEDNSTIEVPDPSAQVSSEHIIRQLFGSLSLTDSDFVVEQLEVMLERYLFLHSRNPGKRELEVIIIQGVHALHWIRNTPSSRVLQFLQQLVQMETVSLANAAAYALQILGTTKEVPALEASIQNHTMSNFPIGALEALRTINDSEGIRSLITIIRNMGTQRSHLTRLGTLEYAILNLGIAVMTSREEVDLQEIRDVLDLVDSREQASSDPSIQRIQYEIDISLRRVRTWLSEPTIFYNSHEARRAAVAICRYRGGSPLATTIDILNLVADKVDWPQPDKLEPSLAISLWIERILIQQLGLTPISTSWSSCRSQLREAIERAEELDLYNCAFSILDLVNRSRVNNLRRPMPPLYFDPGPDPDEEDILTI